MRVQTRTDKTLRNFEAGFWVPQIVETIPRNFVARPVLWQRAMKFRTQGPSAPAPIGWSLMYYSCNGPAALGRRLAS